MKFILGAALLLFSTPPSAATWYSFCYAKFPAKTICSPIELKTFTTSEDCKNFAGDIGADRWGNHTATKPSSLQKKQSLICHEVLGAPLPPPPTTTSYQCALVTFCQNLGGTASSSLSPLGVTVFALTKPQAIAKCLDNPTAINEYLSALESVSNAGDCSIRADAF